MTLTITLLSIIILLKILKHNTNTVCSRFLRIGSVRGVKTIVFKYNVNGENYISSIPFIDCKIREINKIKQLNCVKIEYSKIFPSIGKCIDSRLLIK